MPGVKKSPRNTFRADSRGAASQECCVGVDSSMYNWVVQGRNVVRFACGHALVKA